MNKKNKKTIPFVLLAVVTVIATVFMISRFFIQLRNTSRNYVEEKKELSLLRAKERKLEEEDLESVLKKKENLESFFTNPDRPLAEIIFLEERAEKNNLTHEVSVGEKKSLRGRPYTEFEIELGGELASVLDFFKGLKSRERVLFVDETTFDFNKDNDQEVQATGTLGIFYLENDEK